MSTNKFEVGDKVKLVRLDVNDSIYVPAMNKYLGRIGVVVYILVDIIVRFDDEPNGCFFISDNWLELVEKHKPEPEYWNGQFIVIKECLTKPGYLSMRNDVVIGKVYTLNDGKMTLERGRLCQNYNYKTFGEFAKRLRDFGAEIIEFKGFCKNEGKDHNE